MRRVALDQATRRLVRIWTFASIGAVSAAATLAVGAGGRTTWARLVLAAVSAIGFVRATRHQTNLYVGVGAGLAMLAIVPIDATLDRGVVAGGGAVLILLAAEAAQVARRLVTVAPVRSSRRDALAVGRLGLAAGASVSIAGLVAQVDRWGSRPMIVGLAVAAFAFVWLIRNELRLDG